MNSKPKPDANAYGMSLGVLSSQIVQFLPTGISESREQLFDKVDASILIALNLIEILQRAIKAQEDIIALDPKAPNYRASIINLLSNSPSRVELSEHVDVAFSNAIKLREIMKQLLEEKTTQSEIPPSVGRTFEESELVRQQREEMEKRIAEYLSEEKPPPKLTQTEMDLARASQQEIKDLLRARIDKLNKLIKKAINLVNMLRAIDKKQMKHFGAKDEKELRYILEHGGKPAADAGSKRESESDIPPKSDLSSEGVHATGTTAALPKPPSQEKAIKSPSNAQPLSSTENPENLSDSAGTTDPKSLTDTTGEGVKSSSKSPSKADTGDVKLSSKSPSKADTGDVKSSSKSPSATATTGESPESQQEPGTGVSTSGESPEPQPEPGTGVSTSAEKSKQSDEKALSQEEPSGQPVTGENKENVGPSPDEAASSPLAEKDQVGGTLSTTVVEPLPEQDADTDSKIDSTVPANSSDAAPAPPIPEPAQAIVEPPTTEPGKEVSEPPATQPADTIPEPPATEPADTILEAPATDTEPPKESVEPPITEPAKEIVEPQVIEPAKASVEPQTDEPGSASTAPTDQPKGRSIPTSTSNEPARADLPGQTSSGFDIASEAENQFAIFAQLIKGEIGFTDAPVQASILTATVVLGIILGYGIIRRSFGKGGGKISHGHAGGSVQAHGHAGGSSHSGSGGGGGAGAGSHGTKCIVKPKP